MHCDFLQWDQALQLAQTLAPHRLGDIYLKSAMQLEGAGKTWEDMGRHGKRYQYMMYMFVFGLWYD
jgi:hypothetical protein